MTVKKKQKIDKKKPVKIDPKAKPKSKNKAKQSEPEKIAEKTISIRELASLIMVSERRVQQLTKEGIFRRTSHGIYYLESSVQSYIKHLKESAGGGTNQANIQEFHLAKTRKLKAEAEIAEMNAAQMAGDLITVADVKHTWANLVAEVCNRIRNIPARVVPSILGEIDERKMRFRITEEIDAALSSIAANEEVPN